MITRSYFITGTDTGVGKTVFTCLLARKLRQQGVGVAAYKPACSGAVNPEAEDGNGEIATNPPLSSRLWNAPRPPHSRFWSDIEAHYAATGGRFDRERICPQRFLAPVSPPAAAALEGREVNEDLLITGYQWLAERADVVLVEGAGGFYSPISSNWLNADLAERMGLPVLIVAPNQLGTINHTLLTIEAVRRRGLEVAGVAMNQLSMDRDESAQSNAEEIRRRGQVALFAEIDYQMDALAS